MQMDFEEKISVLADLVRGASGRTFALTGAGVSTESGIPDYRSPGTGLWTKHDPAKTASLSALRRDPALFYSINLKRWTSYSAVQPNRAHHALARLEKYRHIVGVITQNIDSLHIRAGSKRVWEVHGHLRTCRCLECHRQYSFSELAHQVESGLNPPLCSACRGLLRPDVVLFEDPMSSDYHKAEKALSGCQLLLVVGSSLQVYPVAGLPVFARHVAVINQEATPWDERAALVIKGSAGDILDALARVLEPGQG